ncbi:MAG: ankyrin repeat domain-containing protein [Bryobacterales bacterium]|nr:ankyrin repeat domain-containing protein [Bryobacterales bacterium]
MTMRRLNLFALALVSAVSVLAASSPLADAVEAGDKTAIQTLLKKGTDVNATQPDGMTALLWAADRDDLQTAGLLVRAGANVKATNRWGVTPLSIACEAGNAPMVELFLKAGADPNAVLPGGETVLMTAARTGGVEMVKSLISHGANVNAREARAGQTALMWAAAEGNTQAVEALLKAGAEFKARENFGFTPLLFAVREGKPGTVEALLKAGEDPNEIVMPRFRLRQRGAADRVADISKPGTSALAFAVVNAHYEVATKLLEAGANPNAMVPGWTALHAISWIRKPGTGDNQPAPEGSGSMTSLEMVKQLIDHGANINGRVTRNVNTVLTKLNLKGATAYMLAARTGDAELMRYLVKLGADPKIPNDDNTTPLMAAAGVGTRAPGEDPGTESESIEAVQVALDHGGDINAVDSKGETAMHGAAYKTAPAVVQFLAEKGADVKVWYHKNKQGWTPLSIAQGFRFDNFIPSPGTETAVRKLMDDAGVAAAENVQFCDHYAKEECKK